MHYDSDGLETSRTVVTREPEWDDEQREIALGKADYDRQLCPNCHGHLSHTLDPTVGRDVKHEIVKCLDCKAIDEVRAAHHKKMKHTDERCDCNEFMTWVDRYVTRPA